MDAEIKKAIARSLSNLHNSLMELTNKEDHPDISKVELECILITLQVVERKQADLDRK